MMTFTKALQSVMAEAGALHKQADGVWDTATQNAYGMFAAKHGATQAQQQMQPTNINWLPTKLVPLVQAKMDEFGEEASHVGDDVKAVAEKAAATAAEQTRTARETVQRVAQGTATEAKVLGELGTLAAASGVKDVAGKMDAAAAAVEHKVDESVDSGVAAGAEPTDSSENAQSTSGTASA